MATLAPCFANSQAVVLPTPPVAPVITITLSLNLQLFVMLFFCAFGLNSPSVKFFHYNFEKPIMLIVPMTTVAFFTLS
jgi:hypothetical protein